MEDFFATLPDRFLRLVLCLIPLLVGTTLHELAHGWVALKAGDPTAKMAGRLTLNPIAHLDKLGSLVFVLTSLSGSFVFGWAKPVPVDYRYFKNPRRDIILVSLAGAVANLLVAIGFALILALLPHILPIRPSSSFWLTTGSIFIAICTFGIQLNLVLAVFNLLPIPPLDGSKILAELLPTRLSRPYLDLERYGSIIILVLLFTGAFAYVLGPPIMFGMDILAPGWVR